MSAPLLGLLALAACNEDPNRLPFDGIYFKSKTSKFKDGQRDFTVSVFKASQSLEGAISAGEFEGTRYCIASYGTSRINWAIGPDTPRESLVLRDDTLTLQGQCDP